MTYSVSKKGEFNVVEITGNIETEKEMVKEMNLNLADLMNKGEKNFIFNLAALEYIDSAGISIFIDVVQHVKAINGEVYFIVSDDNVRKIISLVGLDQLIKIYNSLEDFEKSQCV